MFLINKSMCFIMRLTIVLETRIKTKKKNISRIRIQSITMVKTINLIQHTKNNRRRKKWRQRWKSIVQINEKCSIWQKMKKLRNRINLKLVRKKKDYLRWTSKPRYMSQKIFDNNVVAICNFGIEQSINLRISL